MSRRRRRDHAEPVQPLRSAELNKLPVQTIDLLLHQYHLTLDGRKSEKIERLAAAMFPPTAAAPPVPQRSQTNVGNVRSATQPLQSASTDHAITDANFLRDIVQEAISPLQRSLADLEGRFESLSQGSHAVDRSGNEQRSRKRPLTNRSSSVESRRKRNVEAISSASEDDEAEIANIRDRPAPGIPRRSPRKHREAMSDSVGSLAGLISPATKLKITAAYKEKIGFTGQLLIEPKPKEPTKHQYDYDAQTVIGFLKTYGLDGHFKLNIEPNHTTLAGHGYEHDVIMASKLGFLGSVDSNTGSPDLGWDTDQFPMDVKAATLVMKAVIEQGGLAPGGLNFDCKVRRESTDLPDMFFSHIGAMDTFARGLRNAVKIVDEGLLAAAIKMRYSGFDKGIGKKIEDGSASLEELEKYILEHGEPAVLSGRQEWYESLLNRYV